MYTLKTTCLLIIAFIFFACGNETENQEIPKKEPAAEVTDNSATEVDSIPELTGTMADTLFIQATLKKAESVLFDSAQYQKSLMLSLQAEKVAKEIIDTTSSHLADAWFALGRGYLAIGNRDSAEYYYTRSLNARLQLFGEGYDGLAESYDGLANVYRQSDVDKSIDYYKRSLKIAERVYGFQNKGVSNIYTYLGNLYLRKSDYENALHHFQQCLAGRKILLGEIHPKIAGAFHNISLTYYYKGAYNLAETYADSVLSIASNPNAEPYSKADRTYNLKAVLLGNRGSYNKALEYHHKTLNIKLEKFGPDHPEIAHSYNNIGIIYWSKKDYEKALEYYLKSLEIRLNNLGESHEILASNYHNIGIVYFNQGKYDTALDYFQKAIKIRKDFSGETHIQLGRIYVSVGSVYVEQGKYEEAKAAIYKSKKIKEEIFGTSNNPLIAMNYDDLSTISLLEENYKESLKFCAKAEEGLGYKDGNYASLTSIPDLITVLNQKSLAYNLAYEITDSIFYLQKAINTSDQILEALHVQKDKYQDFKSKEELTEKAITIIENTLSYKYNYCTQTGKTGYQSIIFQNMETFKGMTHRDMLNLSNVNLTDNIPKSFYLKEQSFKSKLTQLEKQRYLEQEEQKDSTLKDSIALHYNNLIFDAKRQFEDLIDTFKNQYPDYYNLNYNNKVVSVSGVQDSLLSPNQALLEYFVGDSSIFTIIILKDTFHVNEIKKDFPLDSLVKDMLQGIYNPFVAGADHQQSAKRYTNAAHQIYQKVVAPVDALLPENTELIVVPDGILGYIPFDALLVEAPKEVNNFTSHYYFLKDHQVSYAYSATLLKEVKYRQHRKEPSKNTLAFAPSFNKRTSSGDTALLATRYIDISDNRNWLGPLKYNDDEVKAIDALIGADVYLDSLATEDRFTALAGDYRILHLSTHGKANDKVGDYSFLAFYEQDDSLENEWLYNRELYNLQLNADMVVLSACETGIGELQRGEGIISLARGFSYAGAKSIVTTLWSVNDKSSSQLMENFYSHLKTGKTKDAALRQAKLDYLENNASLGVEPFFWAGVIPIGDMSPVDLNSRKRWIYWLGGLLLLLIVIWFVRKRN